MSGCCLLGIFHRIGGNHWTPTLNISHIRRAVHRYWRDYPGESSPDQVFVPPYVYQEFEEMRSENPGHLGTVEGIYVECGNDHHAIYFERPDGTRWRYTGG